jgi:hypothetical protein
MTLINLAALITLIYPITLIASLTFINLTALITLIYPIPLIALMILINLNYSPNTLIYSIQP